MAEALAAVADALQDEKRAEAWSRQWRAARHRYREAMERCTALFAEQRGWRLAATDFTLDMLRRGARKRGSAQDYRIDYSISMVDHPQFFKKDGVPVAVLSHSYQTNVEDHRRYAAERGLTIEVLPMSWYCPGRALAVLYRRPTA